MPRAFASIPAEAPVLVIDAESSDGTVALARQRGAQIVVRPWGGFVAARRDALARVRTPWTFMLDADEALDAALVAALRALRQRATVDGYAVARRTYFCGRAIRGGAWGGERPLRLFRTQRARLVAHPAAGGSADLHEAWHVPGAVERLGGTLEHYSYPTLAAYDAKFARYTALEASGVRASAVAVAFAAALAFARAPWLFIVRGGWRDGWRGAYIAAASAWYPVAVRWKALRR